MQPKHKEILQAIIDGKTIQTISLISHVWYDIPEDKVFEVLSFAPADMLRVKLSTININGFEVPQPIHQELEPGTKYYIPNLFNKRMWDCCVWGNEDFDNRNIERGLVHLTKEAAIQHAEALLSFTQKSKP